MRTRILLLAALAGSFFASTATALPASATIAGGLPGGGTVTMPATIDSNGNKAIDHGLIDHLGNVVDPATADLQTTINTTLATDLGAPGATVCATDTGSCSLNQFMQRWLQRQTVLITALGTPFQAGGTIGNTSFGISGTLPAFASPPTVNIGTGGSLSTAANQTTELGYLSSLVTNTSGLATAALQTTGNGKLDTLHSDLTPAGGLPTSNKGAMFFAGTTAALTASSTYTGATRDVGVAAGAAQPYAYFNSFFLADQAGTATLQCSNDNSTWFTCATSAVVASTPLILTVPVMFRYYRSTLVNGATNQGSFVSNDSFTAG